MFGKPPSIYWRGGAAQLGGEVYIQPGTRMASPDAEGFINWKSVMQSLVRDLPSLVKVHPFEVVRVWFERQRTGVL